MRIETVSHVNGYDVCSYQDYIWDARKFFVRWMDGEYLTQEAAENAARSDELIDHGDALDNKREGES